MECILNTSDFHRETRDYHIFFASRDLILYYHQNDIILSDCSGQIISQTTCPPNYKNYECLETDDSILLLLAGGQRIILIDKAGGEAIHRNLPIRKTGRCYTKIFATNNSNSILIGTGLNQKIQFINYNFMEEKRISQSSSWSMRSVTDCIVKDNRLYVLLDHSFIVACNIDTCANIWTRFETGKTNPKLIPYKGGIAYICQNIIRTLDEEGAVENIHIPLFYPYGMESIIDNKAFITSDDGQSLACCNLSTKELEWEIKGKNTIRETITLKGTDQQSVFDAMLIRIDTGIGLVNLETGQTIAHENIQNLFGMRQTSDHILLHRQEATDMMSSIQNE